MPFISQQGVSCKMKVIAIRKLLKTGPCIMSELSIKEIVNFSHYNEGAAISHCCGQTTDIFIKPIVISNDYYFKLSLKCTDFLNGFSCMTALYLAHHFCI